MTKKDYQLIAGAVMNQRNSYAPNWDKNLFRAMDDISKTLADKLALDNPRFNRSKFLAACGVEL